MRLIADILTVVNSLRVPAGNLGVSRRAMPQIDGKKVERFVNQMREDGVDVVKTKVPILSLRLTQNEINKMKVFKIMKGIRKTGNCFPIFISRDNFVIDGSHRMVAKLNINKHDKIDVRRIEMDALDILAKVKEDPAKYGVVFRSYSDSSL